MHYRVHITKVKAYKWYATKRAGISPPLRYPPSVSGDSITTNDIAFPRSTCPAGLREGHGPVYVDGAQD